MTVGEAEGSHARCFVSSPKMWAIRGIDGTDLIFAGLFPDWYRGNSNICNVDVAAIAYEPRAQAPQHHCPSLPAALRRWPSGTGQDLCANSHHYGTLVLLPHASQLHCADGIARTG